MLAHSVASFSRASAAITDDAAHLRHRSRDDGAKKLFISAARCRARHRIHVSTVLFLRPSVCIGQVLCRKQEIKRARARNLRNTKIDKQYRTRRQR